MAELIAKKIIVRTVVIENREPDLSPKNASVGAPDPVRGRDGADRRLGLTRS